jgi:hypothetical protein
MPPQPVPQRQQTEVTVAKKSGGRQKEKGEMERTEKKRNRVAESIHTRRADDFVDQ